MNAPKSFDHGKNHGKISRRWGLGMVGGLALTVLYPAAAASAVAGTAAGAQSGTRSYTLPQADLEELIGTKFPQRRRLSGLVDISLKRPRLRLLPDSNRLGTLIDLSATELVLGTSYDGVMDLDYGIGFDAADGRIRMTDVHVGRVDFPAVPAQYQSLFAQAAPRVAEQALNGLVLHEVTPEQLALVNGLGFKVGAVQVVREGIRVELLPALGMP